jgi:hypothetical protein
MSRYLVGVVLSAVVLVVASCDDDETRTEAVSPLAPVAEVSPVAALMEAPVKVKGSSVCASYLRERTKLLGQLSATPENKDLLKRATALTSVITDVCN